jgi:hypothetical protein
MAQVVAVLSLGILLMASALVWTSRDLRTDVNAGAAAVSISDVMHKVEVKSLPAQQVEDRTMVFAVDE